MMSSASSCSARASSMSPLHRHEDRLEPQQRGRGADGGRRPARAARGSARSPLAAGTGPNSARSPSDAAARDGVQPVACTLGMDDRALEVGRRVRVAIHGDVAHEPQPGGQPFVVIEQLELGDQRLDRRLERGHVGVGLRCAPW